MKNRLNSYERSLHILSVLICLGILETGAKKLKFKNELLNHGFVRVLAFIIVIRYSMYLFD